MTGGAVVQKSHICPSCFHVWFEDYQEDSPETGQDHCCSCSCADMHMQIKRLKEKLEAYENQATSIGMK